MRVLPCGEHALLIEVDDTAGVLGWAAAIEDAGLDLVDIVPGARTVLVTVEHPAELVAVRAALGRLSPSSATEQLSDRVVEIPTVYDGPDLDEVARLTGLSTTAVIAAHTGQEWKVSFGGFAPGFAYLSGPDRRLQVPRRSEPRSRVPAGSVGLADAFSGVYPRESPGGWQLIGRTDLVLFDLERDPPALLMPRTRVRFVEVGS